MCGIAGAYIRDHSIQVNLDSMLDTMLGHIAHRGGDATGFIALDGEGVSEWHRAACDVQDFVKYRRRIPVGSRTFLAHTRWATQGLPAFIENNHPIRRGPFYVIHNGHVSNDDVLFRMSGREPFGQVDSEAIPALMAWYDRLEDTGSVMEAVEGAAAIAAVDARFPNDLVLAKGYSSPLYALVTNKIVLWGSTHETVEKAYTDHIGRIPRKRKIEYLTTGQMLLFRNGVQTRERFRSYEAPKKSHGWKPGAWQENEAGACDIVTGEPIPATRHLPTVQGWPKWDEADMLEWDDEDGQGRVICDTCGHSIPWQEAEFTWDVQTKTTWAACDLCYTGDRESTDPAEVSQIILEGESEH